MLAAAAAWEAGGETGAGCTDPAAGKFPSGKLLLASDGFFSGTFESGLAEYLPTVSLRP